MRISARGPGVQEPGRFSLRPGSNGRNGSRGARRARRRSQLIPLSVCFLLPARIVSIRDGDCLRASGGPNFDRSEVFVTSKGSKSQALSASSVFSRHRLWIWPLVAALALSALAWWLRTTVEATLRESLASQLQTVLNADVAALDLWFKSQQSTVMGIAGDPEVESLVEQLTQGAQGLAHDQLRIRLAEPIRKLREQMQKQLNAHHYQGFSVIDPDERLLASSYDELIGQTIPKHYDEVFETAMGGKPAVSRPFPSTVALRDDRGQMRPGVPTMVAAGPVFDQAGKVIAVLTVRIPPDVDFTRILSVARMGQTGETYACDADGQMLSESRFDPQLKDIGLLPDRDDAKSIFNVKLRDPEVDLRLERFRLPARNNSRPTRRGRRPRAARAATSTVTATIGGCRASAPGPGCRSGALRSSPSSIWTRPCGR